MNKYKLEKLNIKDGYDSGVRAGRSSTGKCFYAEFDKDNKKVIDITSPEMSDIKVGGYLLVVENGYRFIKTSEILDILKITNDSLTFETTTSIYKLEISDE